MTTIKLKNGSGAPTAGDLVQGEPALDLTNKRLYTEDSGGTVIEVGTNPTSITTGDITATGTVSFAGLGTTGDVTFGDNDKAIFGAGLDLQIYHDGSSSYIVDNGTGNLQIDASDFRVRKPDGSEAMIHANADGAVKLFYDGGATPKLATTSTGIDVTGTITFDGGTTSADLNFGDNNKAIFGAGSDLQIYHDGSNSFINETGTGSLYIGAESEIQLRSYSTNEKFLVGTSNGATSLYYNGVRKLDTTSTGIDVTGSVAADGLTVANSTAPIITLDETGVGTFYHVVDGNAFSIRNNSLSNTSFKITSGGDISFANSAGTSQDLYWDASASSLGLGTTSPSAPLSVKKASTGVADTVADFGNTAVANGLQVITSDGNLEWGFNALNSRSMVFQTNQTERMRIDSSGNLLVGRSSNFSGAKAEIQTNDNTTTLTLNKNNANDGEIIRLAKSGATVGSIGAISSEFYIAHDNTTDSGLRFRNGIIQPCNASGGSNDAAVSLGQPSMRFKDLYLSGGAYLGGTGAANLLDDYEEGSFTPTLTFGGADTGNVYGSQTGRYTKIGNIVHVFVYVRLTTKGTATGNAELSGLPFYADANAEAGTALSLYNNLVAVDTPIIGRISGFNIELREGTTSTVTRLLNGNFTNSGEVRLSATYRIS